MEIEMIYGAVFKKGLLINAAVIVLNNIIALMIYYSFGTSAAAAYGYGALCAQILSVIWFLFLIIGVSTPVIAIAVFGGYFLRIMLLFLFFAIAYKVFHLDMTICAAAFLPVRFILMASEITLLLRFKY